jgi:hypothetical protein
MNGIYITAREDGKDATDRPDIETMLYMPKIISTR